MSHKLRKKERYSVKNLHLKGGLVLFPDPTVIDVELDDISETGAGITVLSSLSENQRTELAAMVKASRDGNKIPVQFNFYNVKIPVVVVNMLNEKRYGLLVSESAHSKLAVLAEKGRQSFQTIIQHALQKGAQAAGYIDYPILSREFLPDDIRVYVEQKEFMDKFLPLLAKQILSENMILSGKIETRADTLKLVGLFIRYLHSIGKDIILLIGASLHFLRQSRGEGTLDQLLPDASHRLFEERMVFSQHEYGPFQSILVEEFVKKKEAGLFKSLPPRHPILEIIKIRFMTFNNQRFFLQGLGAHVCDFYLKAFNPPQSEIVQFYGGDIKLVKSTLMRWIQMELSELVQKSGGRGSIDVIEENYKQAMYELIIRKRSNNITFEETADLYDGKLAPELNDIRDKFLTAICKMIDPQVKARFADYRIDADNERAKKMAEKEEEAKIARMAPLDLFKRFIWPKIKEEGKITQIHREVAKNVLPREKQLSIIEMSGVLMIPHAVFIEFEELARIHRPKEGKAADFFDMIDILDIYSATITMPDGSKRKDRFGMYVDTLQPPKAKEVVMERVISNDDWNRYYILNKPKSYFGKMFGGNDVDFLRIVEEKYIHTTVTDGSFV